MIDPALFGELQKLCLRSFPERLEQRISQIQALGGGRHPMLGFSLAWHEGRQPRVERLIVRRYADPWTEWALDDRRKAQREWAVMRWLYGRGWPVPQLYASGTEGEERFLLLARVPGVPCSPEQARAQAIVDALARQVAQLHQLMPPDSVRETLPRVSVDGELARLGELARCCQAGELNEAIAELRAEKPEERPPCVLHGDFRFEVALCDARGITALLGWENAALGDPRWDQARIVNDLRSHRADALAERFCTVYRERVGAPLADLTFWEALAAVQTWTLIEWVRDRAPSGDAESLLSRYASTRERAWRSLTRLRHTRDERVALGEELKSEI